MAKCAGHEVSAPAVFKAGFWRSKTSTQFFYDRKTIYFCTVETLENRISNVDIFLDIGVPQQYLDVCYHDPWFHPCLPTLPQPCSFVCDMSQCFEDEGWSDNGLLWCQKLENMAYHRSLVGYLNSEPVLVCDDRELLGAT
jgi:hypothetical protein